MNCLLNIEFIMMILYGIPSIVTYGLTCFTIIRRQKLFKGAFYTTYLFLAGVNITVYLNKFVIGRIALYTGKECPTAAFFNLRHFFGLEALHFVHWHVQAVEYALTLVIALDRFLILATNVRIYQIWSGYYWIAIVTSFGIPFAYSHGIAFGSSWFLYSAESNTYQIEFSASHTLLYNGSLGMLVVCTAFSILLNIIVIATLGKGNNQLIEVRRKTEMKLFLNSIAEGIASLITIVLLIVQLNANANPDRTLFNQTRTWLFFSADLQALMPPFILLCTSNSLRSAIKKSVLRRNSSSSSSVIRI